MRADDDAPAAVTLFDLHPPPDRLRDDVLAGLSSRPRRLPPKYFYDEAGALLFEEITELDAYYLTRTELGILERYAGEIGEALGPAARVVEFGSGSGLKTRLLLRHIRAQASYLPVDISRVQLLDFALAITDEFPELEVLPVCADYTIPLTLPSGEVPFDRTIAFFPGSTIGNFEPAEAAAFLSRVGRLCGPGGGFLVGADLHKDRRVLELAYDDPEGITARFNLNLLTRLNRECGTDFDTTAFRHQAFYDERCKRVEIRLVCERPGVVTLPGRDEAEEQVTFRFAPGDFVITEYSHKFTLAGFRELATRTGWSVEGVWTDDRTWFSVWLLRRPA